MGCSTSGSTEEKNNDSLSNNGFETHNNGLDGIEFDINNINESEIMNNGEDFNKMTIKKKNSADLTKTLSKEEIEKMKKDLVVGLMLMQNLNSSIGAKQTIGKGSQGKVRKYYSQKYGKEVVEKVLDLTASVKGTMLGMAVVNLIKEAAILASFDHENIVKIYEMTNDPFCLIMEYCDKGSLRELLDLENQSNARLPLKYKIFLIFSICRGLNYVHEKGVVHGDLKCDNILLSTSKVYILGDYKFPIPKIADFGLGQVGENTVCGGTPGYIAPEILNGSGLTIKSDIYALGMVMFEILSGARPAPPNPEILLALIAQGIVPCTKEMFQKAIAEKEESLLPGVTNEIFNGFYQIMEKCIDDDPNERPTTDEILAIFGLLVTAMDLVHSS